MLANSGEGDHKGLHPTPHHSRPYKDTVPFIGTSYLCKGGGRVDAGMGPLRSPSGEGGVAVSRLW